MKRSAVIAAALTALAAAAPAPAQAGASSEPTVGYMRCDSDDLQRDVVTARSRLGPVYWAGNWENYASWGNMESLRDERDGTYYAKNPMYARAGTIATLSIAPAYRDSADFIYARGPNLTHRYTDVVRIRACKRRRSFASGGLIVRGPTCVLLEVRERGSRRVHRKMVSINMGANCPAR